MKSLLVGWLLMLAAATSLSAAGVLETPDARAQRIVSDPRFRATIAVFEREYDRFVADLITLTQIPAPPFGELPRAQAYRRMLGEVGLEEVEMDAEGNVMGLRRGTGGGPVLAIAAHLDTVFPAGTDVTVKRSGTRLSAPGIGDDTRGLAFLLALVRALRETRFPTTSDILFIGDVGEEGPGDLRGVKYLLQHGRWKDRVARFIALDGANNHLITNAGLGSIRYRVTFKGPGGHSWGAFGIVNPAFAMADAIVRLGRLQVPKEPKTSYSIGMVSGGTSVNSIPFETSMEVDLRSVDPAALRVLDEKFKKLVADAVDAENAVRQTTSGRILAELKLMGQRPSGTNRVDSPMLQQVVAAMKVYDRQPVWNTGSTDANFPISLGIPAFAMAASSVTMGGRAHALDEWTDVEKTTTVRDFELAAAIILSVADAP